MRYRYLATAVVSMLALSGCVSLKSVTAHETGCDFDEIAISNEQSVVGGQTWNASCRGRIHACTWYSTGAESSQVSCRPLESQATGGCKYDTQCKGDRICVSGKCVEPVARQSP